MFVIIMTMTLTFILTNIKKIETHYIDVFKFYNGFIIYKMFDYFKRFKEKTCKTTLNKLYF